MSTTPEGPFKIDLSQCVNNWDTKTKIRRGIWQLLVRPVYLLIPGRRSALRLWILRRFGARIGKNCTIQQRVRILMPWNLHLGDQVAIAHDCCILNFTTVQVGSMTVISQGAHLCTGSHDYRDPHFKLIFKPIRIQPETWVASGSFVGPGVTLGRGCVIGANSVVTRDMPDWKVCAGNPCRPLKDREVREA
ncbi:DapH/DapD/GlmU-related protein [Coraliomargarita parva]|uniref:DapH/DapD/GlmU-related protein n=1 Tax=Coraliomargarita parva TaxID=3014050 RepID=UPI0022B3A1EC|nr:DapH/DapD/GlmU-related protein [Coraliomargarita parva]